MPKKEPKPLEPFMLFVRAIRAKMRFPNLKAIVHLNRPTLETLIVQTPEEVRAAIHQQVFDDSDTEIGCFATQIALSSSLMGLIVFEVNPVYFKSSIEYVPLHDWHIAPSRYSIAPYAFIYDAKVIIYGNRKLDKKNKPKCINGRKFNTYLPS